MKYISKLIRRFKLNILLKRQIESIGIDNTKEMISHYYNVFDSLEKKFIALEAMSTKELNEREDELD